MRILQIRRHKLPGDKNEPGDVIIEAVELARKEEFPSDYQIDRMIEDAEALNKYHHLHVRVIEWPFNDETTVIGHTDERLLSDPMLEYVWEANGLGDLNEKIVVSFLKSQGYVIFDKSKRYPAWTPPTKHT